jgi:hypothetical protein
MLSLVVGRGTSQVQAKKLKKTKKRGFDSASHLSHDTRQEVA